MAISGLVARGAQQSLEEMLERQLLEEQLAAQTEARAASGERENRGLDLRERQFKADQEALDRQLTQRESEQSATQERGRFEATARQNMSELINDPTQLAAFSMASGVDVPAGVRDLTTPKKVNLTRVRTTGPGGKPIARGVTDEELAAGVEEYQEPKAPSSRGSRMWVLRDGQPVRVSEDDIQPGDEPYDPVAARKDGAPTGPSPYASERAERTVQAVDELIGQVGLMTAGLGSLQAMVPGTPARDFVASLDTLKSNIAFNELAQMREASKTGGALGAISERELKLLESTLGALDTGQSPGKLREQLAKVKASVQRWQKAQGEAPSGGGGVPALRFNPATGKLEPIGQ